MQPIIKNLKTKFLYIILPIILVLTLVLLLFRTYQKTQILITGIRPFSELLATDFADVKDEIADPSKCDGSKIVKYLEEVRYSKSPEFLESVKNSEASTDRFKNYDPFKDYDPNIHKLTILDDCWRQYENEYVRFKFRDLNGSLRMNGAKSFEISSEGFRNNLGIYDNSKRGENYINAVLRMLTRNSKFLGMSMYENPNGVIILKTEIIPYEAVPIKKSQYTIDLSGTDRFVYISGYSDRTMKDILSTIEIKK